MKVINQIKAAARAISRAALAMAVGGIFIGFIQAANADQPPYIGSFSYSGYDAPDPWISSINTNGYPAQYWIIQLGSPSILCDNIVWEVNQNPSIPGPVIELQYSSSGPTADWIVYDSGTGGSTRSIWVYDLQNTTFQNVYFLTYGSSYYSDCWEQGGNVHIYNP
ncbi:hypothetical protein GC207_11115 [bacterium]|nr:hypothetical protein [bacterium]